MSNSMIKGNLGADPEMSFNPKGTPQTVFNLAVHAGKDKEGNKQTRWYKVTCYGQLAETANERLKKGALIKAYGNSAIMRFWKDSEDKLIFSETTGLPMFTDEFLAWKIKTPKDTDDFITLS